MALTATLHDTKFGVGDTIKVTQRIVEGERQRLQAFEGMVIGIKGHGDGKSFTVRRIGTAQIGVERIFPFKTPTIENIEVVRKGMRGTRHAKLYYTRDKSRREVERIYSRSARKESEKFKDTQNTKQKTKKAKPVGKSKAKKTSKK